MITTLSNIATIHSGIYTQPKLNGEVYYIQARHFDNDLRFNFNTSPELELDKKTEKHLLRPGDVLVAAKGIDAFAVEYKGIVKPAVASSIFLIIRLMDKEVVLPGYLSWYINQPKTKLYLQTSSKGTSLQSITKADLEKIEIPIPPVKTQELILQIHGLSLKDKELKNKIQILKEQLIQTQLYQTITQENGK